LRCLSKREPQYAAIRALAYALALSLAAEGRLA
jgi:hypothetical protein